MPPFSYDGLKVRFRAKLGEEPVTEVALVQRALAPFSQNSLQGILRRS